LPPLGGSQFDTLSAGLRSNLSVLEGPESALACRSSGDPRMGRIALKLPF
jgi:hypothetical protein